MLPGSNFHKRQSTRLKGYDYSRSGGYFVTICTRNQSLFFNHAQLGNIAKNYWVEIPKHFPDIELDEWVIMPNHVHGIVMIVDSSRRGVQLNAPTTESSIDRTGPVSSNYYSRISPKKGSLGVIIRTYKGMVTKTSRDFGIDYFGWQRGYHDQIIRNRQELDRIRKYIIENPAKWELDEYYSKQ